MKCPEDWGCDPQTWLCQEELSNPHPAYETILSEAFNCLKLVIQAEYSRTTSKPLKTMFMSLAFLQLPAMLCQAELVKAPGQARDLQRSAHER